MQETRTLRAMTNRPSSSDGEASLRKRPTIGRKAFVKCASCAGGGTLQARGEA